MRNRRLILLQELRPHRNRPVQQRFSRVMQLVQLLTLRVVRATSPSLRSLRRRGRGRLFYRLESRQRKKRVEVLHENFYTLDFVFVERVNHYAEMVVDSEHATGLGAPSVGRKEAVVAAAPSCAVDPFPSLRAASLLECELAVDVF